MRLLALAAVAAVFVSTTADAGSVTSRIVSIDEKARTVQLSDMTVMKLGDAVDTKTLAPGMAVEIFAAVDEDGFKPATKVVERK